MICGLAQIAVVCAVNCALPMNLYLGAQCVFFELHLTVFRVIMILTCRYAEWIDECEKINE